jgi:NAD(P)-dependent dehydrogenase (short-subunit alcohol dehydrogenase family)
VLLENKAAVVTGASKGIGQAIAIALAREGADVAINYRSDEEGAKATLAEVQRHGRRGLLVRADVSKQEECQRLIDEAIGAFGRLDVQVNNAAVAEIHPILEMDADTWHRILATNLDHYLYCSQIAARQMIKQGQGGRIINISSISRYMVLSGMSAYCAAKGGIYGLTRVMAIELAPHKISANMIAPGAIETPLNIPFYTPPVRRRYAERIPWEGIGKPEWIANVAVFLASDLSEYVTGQEIVADGGFSINGTVGHGQAE